MIDSVYIISALVMGLIGSLHCLGMCGPIAFSFSGITNFRGKIIVRSLLYNLGRILTYMLIGTVFGLIGKSLFVAGFQRWVSIALGIILIISAIPFLHSKWSIPGTNWTVKLVGRLKTLLGSLLGSKHSSFSLLIGIVNGLLPCGLVYMAAGGSVATGSVFGGAYFMMFFGIGTVPLMFSLPVIGNLVSNNIRFKIRRLMPLFVVLFGLLFILRGANLGIPYVSPQLSSTTGQHACH